MFFSLDHLPISLGLNWGFDDTLDVVIFVAAVVSVVIFIQATIHEETDSYIHAGDHPNPYNHIGTLNYSRPGN